MFLLASRGFHQIYLANLGAVPVNRVLVDFTALGTQTDIDVIIWAKAQLNGTLPLMLDSRSRFLVLRVLQHRLNEDPIIAPELPNVSEPWDSKLLTNVKVDRNVKFSNQIKYITTKN